MKLVCYSKNKIGPRLGILSKATSWIPSLIRDGVSVDPRPSMDNLLSVVECRYLLYIIIAQDPPDAICTAEPRKTYLLKSLYRVPCTSKV